jgi:hypothetical protein
MVRYTRETQVVCIKYTLPLTRIELTALVGVRVRFIVLNATFNNISAISWRSVLMVEETGVPRALTPTKAVSSILVNGKVYLIHTTWVSRL